MKFCSVLLSAVFTICILSGCSADNNMRTNVDFSVPDTAQTTESAAVPTPDSAVTAETAGIAGTLGICWATPTHRGGTKSSTAMHPGGTPASTCLPTLQKRLEVPAGMPNGIPESVRPGDLLVDDTQLVWDLVRAADRHPGACRDRSGRQPDRGGALSAGVVSDRVGRPSPPTRSICTPRAGRSPTTRAARMSAACCGWTRRTILLKR